MEDTFGVLQLEDTPTQLDFSTSLEGSRVDSEFMSLALEQATLLDTSGRWVRGPYSRSFDETLGEIDRILTAVDPQLPREALIPKTYWSAETDTAVRELPAWKARLVDQLAHGKIHALTNLVQGIGEELETQQVGKGLLDAVENVPESADRKSCTARSFRMLFEAITGDEISERVLNEAMLHVVDSGKDRRKELLVQKSCVGDRCLPDDDILLRVFKTDAFRDKYKKTVTVISFGGFDFETIDKVARAARTDPETEKVLCKLNIGSIAVSGGGIQHNVILEEVNKTNVVYRDPNRLNQQPDVCRKRRFVDFWGEACLRGQVLISAPESCV